MIDRIEELLGSLAEENEDEEREDVLTQKCGKAVSEGSWTVARESDGAIGPRDQPEWSGKRPSDLTALQRDNGAAKPRIASSLSVTAEKRGAVLGSGLRSERSESGETAGELWKGGPVWTVRGAEPETGKAQSISTAGRAVQPEEAIQLPRDGEPVWAGLKQAAQGGAAGLALEGVRRSGTAQAGLEGLYRQSVRGLRPAAPALPPEQAGRTARTQEPGSTASLAVDELDRAVRRDSRRYDGGMSIY